MRKVTVSMIAILFCFATSTFAQENDALRKTKGYIVFSMGVNSLSNSPKNIYDNLDMVKSRFYEIGYARNSRLSADNNLLHLNYGLLLVYNNVRVKNGYIYTQKENEVVAEFSSDVNKMRLRNSYLQVPIYLEFDFMSDERFANPNKTAKKGLKIGVGGFMGFKIKTKQFVHFNDGKEETYTNLETNNFTYGVGAYMGYSFVSLFVKYDIQSMFKQNIKNNPHNVSLGLKIDL